MAEATTTGLGYAPDYAVPPGETLLEVLEELGMSQAELAERIGRPKKTVNEIVKGKAAITPETALQLERALRIPARFWDNLQRKYETALARLEERKRLERPPEARSGGEPYEDWERLMGLAADSALCERPDMPNGNSADCPCPPCAIANWWDGLGGLERGVLFAGMVEQGFEWGRK